MSPPILVDYKRNAKTIKGLIDVARDGYLWFLDFLVDGKQYIAVQSGWGLDARSIQARLNTQFPGKFPEVPEGGAIWVFAVK